MAGAGQRIVGRLGSLLSLAIAGRHLYLCSPSLTSWLVSYIGVYGASGCRGVWGGGSRPSVSCNQFPQKGRCGCYLIGSRYIKRSGRQSLRTQKYYVVHALSGSHLSFDVQYLPWLANIRRGSYFTWLARIQCGSFTLWLAHFAWGSDIFWLAASGWSSWILWLATV